MLRKAKYVKLTSGTVTILPENKKSQHLGGRIFLIMENESFSLGGPGLGYDTLRTVALCDTSTRS